MAFWQRSNGSDFMSHYKKFLKFWVEKDSECGKDESKLEQAFIQLATAGSPDQFETKTSIEHLLDFYDEACSAVRMSACDEDAMFFYLGPIMILHWRRLRGFIEAWLAKQHRPEKWGCFVHVAQDWEPRMNDQRFPSGKPLPYPTRT